MSESTIDPATFAALCEMAGREFAKELVQTFFEEAPPMLADLATALATGNAERYRRAAHSLKSNGQTFGAMRLAAMAKILEIGGVDASTPAALEALDEEYARVTTALKALTDG